MFADDYGTATSLSLSSPTLLLATLLTELSTPNAGATTSPSADDAAILYLECLILAAAASDVFFLTTRPGVRPDRNAGPLLKVISVPGDQCEDREGMGTRAFREW